MQKKQRGAGRRILPNVFFGDRAPWYGLELRLHDADVPSTAALKIRAVTPGGPKAKGARGRDPAAHPTAPHTAIMRAAVAAPGRVVTPSGR